MVNAGSPHLDPSANADGGIPSTYSPIFTSNAYTPTPHTTLMPSRLPHLDPPVSPKTIPAPPYYVFPLEPVKAVTTDGAHRTAQAARHTSLLKSNYSAGEEKSDISRNERQNRSSTASSPSSASPLRGSITPQSASSDGASTISNSGRRRRSGETKVSAQGRLNEGCYSPTHSIVPASAIAVPVSSSSSQESHIVNLGPDPNLACCGPSGPLARRVTISIPSRSSIRLTSSAKSGSVTSSRLHRTPATSTFDDGTKVHESHLYRSGDD